MKDYQHLLTKEDQFNSISSYYGKDLHNMIDFFLKTEGCLVLADDFGIVLAYRVNLSNFDEIDSNANNLYIQYLTGNIIDLIQLCSDDIEYLIWDRRGKTKVYKLSQLKRNIDKFK